MSDQQLLPGYLVVGPDEVKRAASISRLKKRLEASGMADFNFDERDMTKEQQPDDVLASLNTLPMGAEFRLVVLEGCDRLPKAMSEALVSYFGNPSRETVCLVTATSLAKSTRLYKAIAKLGKRAVIDCSAQKPRELPKTVQGLAARYRKTISLAAAEELIARAGTSTRMLDNELKKLASMIEDPSIERDDVEQFVVHTAEVKPWVFLDAVSARNAARAMELFSLMPPRSEYRLFPSMVARIRELIVAKSLAARGQARELSKVLGVQEWQVKHHAQWARGFTMDELIEALRSAQEVELALKGSRDSQMAFIAWVLSVVARDRGRR